MSKEEKESAETENRWRRPGLTNEQIADIKHALFPELTKEQIADIKQAFDCFDVDGSGAIDHDEMAKVVAVMGHHTEDEVRQLIEEADVDGNKEIDFDEFLQFLVNHMPGKPDPVKEVSDAFSIFDHYGNGTLDASEIQLAMFILGKSISLEDAQAMVDVADIDDDGELTFDEFMKKLAM